MCIKQVKAFGFKFKAETKVCFLTMKRQSFILCEVDGKHCSRVQMWSHSGQNQVRVDQVKRNLQQKWSTWLLTLHPRVRCPFVLPDTHCVKSPTSKEWRGGAEVSVVKLDIVGPLFPSSQTPRRPPSLVVQLSSPVVILSDLYAQHAALRANWAKQKH